MQVMEENKENSSISSHILIHVREKTDENHLIRPNEDFMEFIKKIVNVFETNFDMICYKENVISNFVQIFKKDFFLFASCEDHIDFVLKETFKILLRAFLKRKTADFKISKKKLQKLDNLRNI